MLSYVGGGQGVHPETATASNVYLHKFEYIWMCTKLQIFENTLKSTQKHAS